MTAKRILIVALLVLAAGLTFNQWRLQVALDRLAAPASPPTDPAASEQAAARLHQAEERLEEVRQQLQLAEQRLAAATAQIARTTPPPTLDLANGRRAPAPLRTRLIGTDGTELTALPPAEQNTKRNWGPEQAAGAPDTFQAGDVPTAWASREPDGGEEWLKLEYEKSVDIAEVRVRETHNPGAVSKVTAFLVNGSEVTLWEGTEPATAAPVEMSFTIPTSVNAKSVKVYLDTRRVAGWNEIDAVELIGRDGSHQWAKQATASSTYAEPRVQNLGNRLIEFEDRLTR